MFLPIRRKHHLYRKHFYYKTGNFNYMVSPLLKNYCFNLIRFENRIQFCAVSICVLITYRNVKQLHHRMSSVSHQILCVHQPLFLMEIQCMLAKIQVSYVRFVPRNQTIQRQMYIAFTC